MLTATRPMGMKRAAMMNVVPRLSRVVSAQSSVVRTRLRAKNGCLRTSNLDPIQ